MKRIRELREARSLTQEALAEFLSVSRSTLAKWEAGRHSPPAETLARLAVILCVSTDYLLGITDDPAPARPGPRALVTRARRRAPEAPAATDDAIEEAVRKRISEMPIEEFLRLQGAGDAVLEHVTMTHKAAEMVDKMRRAEDADELARKG